MIKFRIGDKVRVRKDLKEKYYKDNNGKGLFFSEGMSKYKSKLLTIKCIEIDGNYRVEENDFYWCDEMLEGTSKSSILDNTEFNYLWNIIKPFKDSVKFIKKIYVHDYCHEHYYIRIYLYNNRTSEDIILPYFSTNSPMYKGMEVNKFYTLEDLGFNEPKPKLNCKVVCIESDDSWLTVGKIYEFKDGKIVFNDRSISFRYNSVEEFNKLQNEGCKLQKKNKRGKEI